VPATGILYALSAPYSSRSVEVEEEVRTVASFVFDGEVCIKEKRLCPSEPAATTI
tara:strand:+ start:3328 stop:3492 length:165 start_codon:yes stop_codon:yes gene_type:complete